MITFYIKLSPHSYKEIINSSLALIDVSARVGLLQAIQLVADSCWKISVTAS